MKNNIYIKICILYDEIKGIILYIQIYIHVFYYIINYFDSFKSHNINKTNNVKSMRSNLNYLAEFCN